MKTNQDIETLENIFYKYSIKKIDLAIIDVEGSEIELLRLINYLMLIV